MINERFDALTDAQRECLRLVSQGYESKEIARLLGITHHAVDTRLSRAVHVLQATGRRDAARSLAAHEFEMSGRTAYAPPHGDRAAPAVNHQASINEERQNEALEDVTTAASGPHGTVPLSRRRRFGWPVSRPGRRRNDLSFIAVLFWVATGAITIGFIALGLVAIALTAHDGLSELFQTAR